MKILILVNLDLIQLLLSPSYLLPKGYEEEATRKIVEIVIKYEKF